MSSASRLGLIVAAGAFATALGMTIACGQPPPSGGTAKTAPPATTVGQVPGPQPSQPTPSNTPPTVNPFSQDRTAMAEGRQLFVRFNCSGCHGGRAGGGMGPSLRDVDWIYGNDDARIYGSIAEGRAHGMPAWRSRMTPDQIWKLVTYIKSLRTTNEPNAPPPS
jgi:cytochrome c oxidase cbb3-type subunit III